MNIKKEKQAIERLRAFEPVEEPYFLCYSGGKDSDCIRILAQLANVRHELHHNLTTVDSPETLYYIRSIPEIRIDRVYDKDGKHVTMWNLIPRKGMPPTRIYRYCCEIFKESGGKGRLKITGVRQAESINRSKNTGLVNILTRPVHVRKFAEMFGAEYQITKQDGTILNLDNAASRRLVEQCYRTSTTMVNPMPSLSVTLNSKTFRCPPTGRSSCSATRSRKS